MKKLILGALMVMGFISFSNAQKIEDTATKKSAAKKVAAKPLSQAKKNNATNTVAAKQAVKPTVATSRKPADGTPGKRNTNAADTGKGPLKKVGTPHKRHKSK